MDWQKKTNEKEYKRLREFFKKRPMLLVDCGLYMNLIDGVRFFFRNSKGLVEERDAKWEEMGKMGDKAYMSKIALNN